MFMDELNKIDAATAVDSNISKLARRKRILRHSSYMLKSEADSENPTRKCTHVIESLGDKIKHKQPTEKTA